MNITERPGERVIVGTLDELRGVLPAAEVEELERFVADYESGELERKADDQAAIEALMRQRQREIAAFRGDRP